MPPGRFSPSDADAWYRRNVAHLERYDVAADPVWQALRAAGVVKAADVLDVGCSLATRCAAVAALLGARPIGIDASREAIDACRARWPDGRWQERAWPGLSDAHLPCADVVVVSFCLHWVARRDLMLALYQLDEALVDGGTLVINDFWPAAEVDVPFRHRAGVWTYKRRYPAMLVATGLYEEAARVDYTVPGLDGSPEAAAAVALRRRPASAQDRR